MSMFYCNSCDLLVDSDEVLFIYDYKTDHWTCQNCLDANEDVDTEQVLEDFNTYWTEEATGFQLWQFLKLAKKSKKRNLDKHSTGE